MALTDLEFREAIESGLTPVEERPGQWRVTKNGRRIYPTRSKQHSSTAETALEGALDELPKAEARELGKRTRRAFETLEKGRHARPTVIVGEDEDGERTETFEWKAFNKGGNRIRPGEVWGSALETMEAIEGGS